MTAMVGSVLFIDQDFDAARMAWFSEDMPECVQDGCRVLGKSERRVDDEQAASVEFGRVGRRAAQEFDADDIADVGEFQGLGKITHGARCLIGYQTT